MFRIYKLSDKALQLDIDAYSFYSVGKIPVGFRPSWKNLIYITDKYFQSMIWEDMNYFLEGRKWQSIPTGQFDQRFTEAYNMAILSEARKIGLQSFNMEKTNGNSRSGNAGETVYFADGIVA